MSNSSTNCRLLLYMFRMSHKLRHNNTAAKALLVLPRPRVLMVRSLQSSTVTTNAKLSTVPPFLLRKRMAKPGSSFPKKNMQSTGRRTNVTPSLNAADVIF
jgi:hypothetical protein